MKQNLNKLLLVSVMAFALCSMGLVGNRVTAQSGTAGAWSMYPQQATQYTAIVRPPVKADGSSVFNGSGTSTIPLKFKLTTAPGALKFESIYSNNDTCEECPEGEHSDDFAFLSFTPSNPMVFNDISVLKATYAFTQGNCGGGSLRWAVTFDINGDNETDPENGSFNDRSIFIYYGDYPGFTDCTTGSNNQSGVNMIGMSDLRYDTSQVGGTFYDTYANAQALVGGSGGSEPVPALRVTSITLALDSGWMADQRVTLSNAEVNGNMFVPTSGGPATTCNLPEATLTITKLPGSPIEQPVTVQRPVGDTLMRTTGNDCTYNYNLATSSLLGPGDYTVDLFIGLQKIPNQVKFRLR